MDEMATRELDTQALEQILIGHMMAIAGEANQIFRPVTCSTTALMAKWCSMTTTARPAGSASPFSSRAGIAADGSGQKVSGLLRFLSAHPQGRRQRDLRCVEKEGGEAEAK